MMVACRVVAQEGLNKMGESNIAMVFGPSLTRSELSAMHDIQNNSYYIGVCQHCALRNII